MAYFFHLHRFDCTSEIFNMQKLILKEIFLGHIEFWKSQPQYPYKIIMNKKRNQLYHIMYRVSRSHNNSLSQTERHDSARANVCTQKLHRYSVDFKLTILQ